MKRAVIIMAKYPQAGKVKTRLHPFLTFDQCAGIAAAFLQDTINKVNLVCSNPILAYSPPEKTDALKKLLPSQSICIEQTGRDLGERMFNAFKFAFDGNLVSVVMIGTDSPTFPPDFITQAFENLMDSDVVLGETEDGGFYLIGLRVLSKAIFENVNWSSTETFRQTTQNIENVGLKCSFLPVWFDVDFPADLKRLRKELEENQSIAPKTFQWLKENLSVDERRWTRILQNFVRVIAVLFQG